MKPPKPLRAAIITVVAVVVVVFLLPAAFWFYNWQNDRVGIGGKTRTVMQMEQSPLVAPEVAGLKRLKYGHSHPVGPFGKFGGNFVNALYFPPPGKTEQYFREFIKLAENQDFVHRDTSPTKNSAIMEWPQNRPFRKVHILILDPGNGPNLGSEYYNAIYVSLEG